MKKYITFILSIFLVIVMKSKGFCRCSFSMPLSSSRLILMAMLSGCANVIHLITLNICFSPIDTHPDFNFCPCYSTENDVGFKIFDFANYYFYYCHDYWGRASDKENCDFIGHLFINSFCETTFISSMTLLLDWNEPSITLWRYLSGYLSWLSRVWN